MPKKFETDENSKHFIAKQIFFDHYYDVTISRQDIIDKMVLEDIKPTYANSLYGRFLQQIAPESRVNRRHGQTAKPVTVAEKAHVKKQIALQGKVSHSLAKYKKAIVQATSAQDILQVWSAVLYKAKDGDLKAADMVLSRVTPKLKEVDVQTAEGKNAPVININIKRAEVTAEMEDDSDTDYIEAEFDEQEM